MRILFAASEVYPYSKTGGLADMANFLPKSLAKIGYSMILITPYYQSITKYHDQMDYMGNARINFGDDHEEVHYYRIMNEDVEIIFVQNQRFFERDGFYGYKDDDRRFILFSYATLEYIKFLKEPPQIIHCNDWQTGPIPYLLDEHYRNLSKYKHIHTLLTIHNIEHQGVFNLNSSKFFNHSFDYTYIHFDNVNYLKTGIERASKINTVSPNYRNEVLTEKFSFTLDGALKKRANDFSGILNGIDFDVFDPRTDELIKMNYNTKNLTENKMINKNYLMEQFNLENKAAPLVAYIGRMAHQKGIYLMEHTLEKTLNETNANFIILGTGENHYENYFAYLASKYPSRVAYYRGYNETLAHQIYAGSDIFMMPSLFEPCGLAQMMAMRYGTIPVVRETGGLKDTVTAYDKFKDSGTGFSFYDENPEVFKNILIDAINLYNNNPDSWRKLMKRAMGEKFGLEQMAVEYSKLYKKIVEG